MTDHVFDGRQDLGEDDLAVGVRELPLVADPVVQVSSPCVLQHQVEAAGSLHHLVQTDHVGVLQGLHAADLPGQQALGLYVQPRPVQDLQGHFVYEGDRRLVNSVL